MQVDEPGRSGQPYVEQMALALARVRVGIVSAQHHLDLGVEADDAARIRSRGSANGLK
jgi:hypothetical protein